MRKLLFFLLATLSIHTVLADDIKGFEIQKHNGENLHIANTDILTMTFEGGNAVLTSVAGETLSIPRSEIIAITSLNKCATEYTVNYNGTTTTVTNPYALQGVTTEIDGGYVTTTNTNEAVEMTFALSGNTADGGFTYNGTYKTTIRLNGVGITNQRGAAIDIQCGKRIAVVLADGTTNTLADNAGGEQKAALYFKGHPEFEGGGTLNITGNTSHGIFTKEYLQLKKSVGTINILAAANDGIHAKQYIQINGGAVTISNVVGDGIQAEPTDDPTDIQNGQMIIKGGELNISVSGSTADCLKADSLITIAGGTLNLTTTGNGIEDTATNAPQREWGPGGWGPGGGNTGGSQVETSSPKCINGGMDITITGGTITALSTGKGGKGIVCDGILTIGGEDMTPVVSCTTTGSVVAGSGENLSGQPKAIKAEGNIYINSGYVTAKTSQNGGEGIETKSEFYMNGGTVVCNTYDDGINAANKITFNGGLVWSWASNNDGVDCNGSSGIVINGGTIVSNGTSSPEEGFDCDNYSFVITGGTALGVGGSTSSVTSASQPYAQTTSVKTTKDRYLSMVDASGNVILSYLCPVTLSSATVVSTSPEYGNNTSCKLVYGATAVNNPTETLLDGRILLGGTLTGGTTKSITPKTK